MNQINERIQAIQWELYNLGILGLTVSDLQKEINKLNVPEDNESEIKISPEFHDDVYGGDPECYQLSTIKERNEDIKDIMVLKGRIGIDENDQWINEIKSYKFTPEQLLRVRYGLVYAFDNEFGLSTDQQELKQAILQYNKDTKQK